MELLRSFKAHRYLFFQITIFFAEPLFNRPSTSFRLYVVLSHLYFFFTIQYVFPAYDCSSQEEGRPRLLRLHQGRPREGRLPLQASHK